jgi:hypothetical protein
LNLVIEESKKWQGYIVELPNEWDKTLPARSLFLELFRKVYLVPNVLPLRYNTQIRNNPCSECNERIWQ